MPEPPHLPPAADLPLSVVLPAYNQEPHLDDALEKWTRHLDKLQRDYELLVIDDGSTDQTAARAEAARTLYPRLRMLRHEAHLGIGAALRTGLASVQYPLVCCCPCEPAYQPADVKALLGRIDPVHLVTGIRVEQGNPARRHLPPRWYRWFVRWVFGVRVTDVGCGFWLFRRGMLSRMPIQSNGPFVYAEILAKANFLGCVLDEVPVSYRPQGNPPPTAIRPLLREAGRVFNRPDFGPAVLEGAAPGSTGSEANLIT